MKTENPLEGTSTKPGKPQPMYALISGEVISVLNTVDVAIATAVEQIERGNNDEITIYKMVPMTNVKKAKPTITKL